MYEVLNARVLLFFRSLDLLFHYVIVAIAVVVFFKSLLQPARPLLLPFWHGFPSPAGKHTALSRSRQSNIDQQMIMSLDFFYEDACVRPLPLSGS